MKKIILLAITGILFNITLTNAQITVGDNIQINYNSPKEYEIGGITVTGTKYLDQNVLIMLTGLNVGDKIPVPGEKITSAIKKLWKQGLFEDIKIVATDVQDDLIFLEIQLSEKPRLSKFRFTGVNKSEADDLREKLEISRGDVVTDNLILSTEYKIKKFFIGKGFLDTEVKIKEVSDTTERDKVILDIAVKKHKKVKINRINFINNDMIYDGVLKRSMKETKEKTRVMPFYQFESYLYHNIKDLVTDYNNYNYDIAIRDYFNTRFRLSIFKGSKYIPNLFRDDKTKVIDKYNELGYRDAIIIKDSIVRNPDKTIDVNLYVKEGHQYYFRNITWAGNTKYTTDKLNAMLRIEKGDIYNQKQLETSLYGGGLEGNDVSSLYMDDGYLFFNANPVEMNVENDSIDIEIRLYEGKQATIDKVILKGNTRTNDHVVYREIRTKPGQLFSRSAIIRTQRELAQLRYFNAETLGVNPIPNPQESTVDIEYQVEEASSDQIELSGGWGYGMFIGTLGLSFNNFSARNIFNGKAYQPLPSGDGQKVGIRAQTTGKRYQNYSFSFTEPWLGGKKPNSLTVSVFHSSMKNLYGTNSNMKMKIWGGSIGLGKRLQWPDDYFTLYQGINIQNYDFKNYNFLGYANGSSNNINYNIIIGRNSTDFPLFPRTGSDLSLSIEATPPYSLFDKIDDYSSIGLAQKYRWIEYHKWKINYSWYTNLAGNLVLNSKAKFGFIGKYNRKLGDSPFERFYLGGDGMYGGGGMMDSREIIGLRGYDNYSITPVDEYNNQVGGTSFNKFTLELKYPLSLNPNATIYVLTFAEGGNAWKDFTDYNAFDLKRSAGAGLRLFLPMLGGLLGFDWGYGFDEIPQRPDANRGHFHFSINQSLD